MPQRSAARTVSVFPVGDRRRGVHCAPPWLEWPEKSSAGVLDYTLDLTDWLCDIADTLKPNVATINIFPSGNPADLAASQPVTAAGYLVGCMLAGGLPGVWYCLSIAITTTSGLTEVFLVHIRINFASQATAAPNPLLPPSVLVSQAGIPFETQGGDFIVGQGA